MKRLFLPLATALLLVACNSGTTVKYQLSFKKTESQSTQNDLTTRSLKIIERRVDALQSKLLDEHITTENGKTGIELEIADAGAASVLTEQLTAPFTLEIMRQAKTGSGDVTVQGHGSFEKTGITGDHIDWAESAEDDAHKGAINIKMTSEGAKLMGQLLKSSKGEYIGIFVRGKLVSKLNVKDAEFKESIIIRDIPSAEMAQVFADDLNVGLHVIFTPLP